jgi:hypothetical protein
MNCMEENAQHFRTLFSPKKHKDNIIIGKGTSRKTQKHCYINVMRNTEIYPESPNTSFFPKKNTNYKRKKKNNYRKKHFLFFSYYVRPFNFLMAFPAVTTPQIWFTIMSREPRQIPIPICEMIQTPKRILPTCSLRFINKFIIDFRGNRYL